MYVYNSLSESRDVMFSERPYVLSDVLSGGLSRLIAGGREHEARYQDFGEAS